VSELQLEIDGPVARLVISRPDKRNALSQRMWDQLADLVLTVGDDPTVRVLAISSSAAGVFCAGADIDEYRRHAGDVDWGLASEKRVSRALEAIGALGVPTVAVIDGACVGGGCAIAVACDFRMASDRSFFAITPARLGLVYPHSDITTLVDLVGGVAAKRMLFTGARFDAEWARGVGLVDELHPVDELPPALDRLVSALTSVSPGAVRSMKEMVGLVQAGVRAPTERTRQLAGEALRSADHREGVTAFLEKRPPQFTPGPR
jgi:enoyl-CoA hydratase/carnithine racemase